MVNWKPYSEDKEENEVPKNVGFWGHKFEQYMKAGRFLKPFIEGLVIKKYITHLRWYARSVRWEILFCISFQQQNFYRTETSGSIHGCPQVIMSQKNCLKYYLRHFSCVISTSLSQTDGVPHKNIPKWIDRIKTFILLKIAFILHIL